MEIARGDANDLQQALRVSASCERQQQMLRLDDSAAKHPRLVFCQQHEVVGLVTEVADHITRAVKRDIGTVGSAAIAATGIEDLSPRLGVLQTRLGHPRTDRLLGPSIASHVNPSRPGPTRPAISPRVTRPRTKSLAPSSPGLRVGQATAQRTRRGNSAPKNLPREPRDVQQTAPSHQHESDHQDHPHPAIASPRLSFSGFADAAW